MHADCRVNHPRCAPSPRRRAFTLVEMLVAVGVTMIMLFAILRLAAMIGESTRTGRSLLELSGELRTVCHRLQTDLDSATCKSLQWTTPGSAPGYFEYVEGPIKDVSELGQPDNPHALRGAVTDVLSFTVKAQGFSFAGRYLQGTAATQITSEFAEVIWWVTREPSHITGEPPVYKLRRRVLLIRPDLPMSQSHNMMTLLQQQDISVSRRPWLNPLAPGTVETRYIANSLSDLSQREHRTLNQSPILADIFYPFPGHSAWLQSPTLGPGLAFGPDHPLAGEEIMLGNVLAFDVRVYDPHAPVIQHAASQVALSPGDPGYLDALGSNPNVLGYGAYVDLGYAPAMTSAPFRPIGFHRNPFTLRVNNSPWNWPVPLYDTWTLHYESNGLDEDGNGVIDDANDGLDNNGNGLIDDPTERETTPPYPFPLRGLKVTLRAMEQNSRQVRQASVVADFVPN